MADTDERIVTFNLWRYFRGQKPQHRWACEVTEDPKADHGFRVEQFDDSVADSFFWDKMAKHFETPLVTKRGAYQDKLHVMEVFQLQPGEEDFFQNAVRTVPMAIVGPERGSRS